MLVSVSNSATDLCGKLGTAFPRFDFRALSVGQVRVESAKPISLGPLVRFIEEQGIEVAEARRVIPSLEEVFVRVTGIEVEAMKKEREKAGGHA